MYVDGTFTMSGGIISGNTGRGVSVSGKFIMSGGSISSNSGSGVYVENSSNERLFLMEGGTISGNSGNGVDVGYTSNTGYSSGTFTMSGGNISSNSRRGVNVQAGTFIMKSGTISGHTADANGGGVYVNSRGVSFNTSGRFTMSGGTISGNTSSGNGGGVYVGGTFTMTGGTISGNTASGNGGGVYGSITKTGGTISGNDAAETDRNTAKQGHAVHNGTNWRNATAGPRMNTDTYGFWLNEVEVVEFPSGFIGTWKRDNFNNTLTFSANFFTDSAQPGSIANLVRISGNSYTCAWASNGSEFTLTFRLVNGNIEISGDSGNGETNWNGTWRKQR